MAQFEDYLEKKKKDELFEYRADLEKKQLKAGAFEVGMDSAQLVQYYQSRIDHTSFKDRTAYYFEDAKLMGSKAQRYHTIAKGGGDVEQYAADHINHSADKRRKSAKKATAAFLKAGELINKYQKKPAKDLYETYTRREEIMRARMAGMELAAETKSTSEENEIYLKSKARISCLMVLYDQIKNLRKEAKRTGDAKLLKKFDAREKGIRKELMAVQQTMKDHTLSADEKWREENKLTRTDVMAEIERNRHDAERDHSIPQPDFEEMSLKLEIQSLVKTTKTKGMAFPAGLVRLDRKGQPVTLADAKKQEWNQRYKAAVEKGDRETVDAMKIEALKRIEEYDMPEGHDLKEHDILAIFRNKVVDNFEMMVNVPRFLKDEEKNNPDGAVMKYLKAHPILLQKTKILRHLGKFMGRRMQAAGLNPNTGRYLLAAGQYRSYELGEDENRQYASEFSTLYKKYHDLQKADYLKQEEEEKNEQLSLPTAAEEQAELRRLREENHNPNLTKDSYKIYKGFRASVAVFAKPAYKKIASDYNQKRGQGNLDISRSHGVILRAVHYDKSGKPISEEDRRLEEQNDRFMNSLVEKENETEAEKAAREAVQTEIIEKEVGTIFEGFTFPKPKDLKSWTHKMLKEKPFEFSEMIHRALAYDQMSLVFPAMKEYRDAHPELDRKLNVATALNQMCSAFTTSYYGVKTSSAGAVIESSDVQNEFRTEFDDASQNMSYVQSHLEGYTNLYHQLATLLREEKNAENAELARQKNEFREMQQKNPHFTEEGYRLFNVFRESNGVLIRQEYVDIAERYNAKIKEENEKLPKDQWKKPITLSRGLGVVLRSVHMKNGKPATMKDVRLEKQNMAALKAWEEDDEETKVKMIKESLPDVFDGFTLPKPETMEKWMLEMLEEKPFELRELIRRNLSISNVAEEYPDLIKTYRQEHPEWAEKEELVVELSSWLLSYTQAKHLFTDAGITDVNAVVLPETEADVIENSKMMMEIQVGRYDEAYQRVQARQKERKEQQKA